MFLNSIIFKTCMHHIAKSRFSFGNNLRAFRDVAAMTCSGDNPFNLAIVSQED